MGASTVHNWGRAKTADEAFDALLEEDQYENGHAYDTGTIGCASDGFVMHPLGQKRFTKKAINRWVDDAVHNTSKHEPLRCLAIPKSCKLVNHSTKRGVYTFLFVGWVCD